MSQLLQYVLTGLATGATYALVGLGIVLVVQVTGVINFAQGDFVMLGALGYAGLTGAGAGRVVAGLVVVVAVVMVGAATNLLVIRPARRASPDRLIILTIGASIVIQGVTLVVAGTSPRFSDPFTGGAPLRMGGARLPVQYVWVFAVTAAAVLAVWYFLTRTRQGVAMRATAMNPEAARMVGIPPHRMSLLVFMLAAGLGAVAGVVLAPLQPAGPQVGIALGLRGFTAAVVGGLTNPAGAVAGGLALGVVEALAGGYLSTGFAEAIAYAVLLAVLLAAPTGLLALRGGSAARP
jgi:branched-chain amino acid transport system permease protein